VNTRRPRNRTGLPFIFIFRNVHWRAASSAAARYAGFPDPACAALTLPGSVVSTSTSTRALCLGVPAGNGGCALVAARNERVLPPAFNAAPSARSLGTSTTSLSRSSESPAIARPIQYRNTISVCCGSDLANGPLPNRHCMIAARAAAARTAGPDCSFTSLTLPPLSTSISMRTSPCKPVATASGGYCGRTRYCMVAHTSRYDAFFGPLRAGKLMRVRVRQMINVMIFTPPLSFHSIAEDGRETFWRFRKFLYFRVFRSFFAMAPSKRPSGEIT
jgi:hypothetical protein